MAEEFTWLPDDGVSGQVTPRFRSLQMGDGYRQIIGDGLNIIERSYSVSFNRSYAVIEDIDEFLTARAMVPEAFSWTPPGPDPQPGFYICEDWRVASRSGQNAILTATFTQVFFP